MSMNYTDKYSIFRINSLLLGSNFYRYSYYIYPYFIGICIIIFQKNIKQLSSNVH